MTNYPASEHRYKRSIDTSLALWAELLFIILPFLVTFIVLIYKGETSRFIYISEWSLAAAILSGQTAVKFISGLLLFERKFNLSIVTFIVSGLIVIILAPSLVMLSLILVSEQFLLWMGIAQIILFFLAVSSFLFLGKVIQALFEIDGDSKRVISNS